MYLVGLGLPFIAVHNFADSQLRSKEVWSSATTLTRTGQVRGRSVELG